MKKNSSKEISQLRLTGSKLETPMTAPTMAVSTTPPATMLSKKFLREGETPESAAWATSGMTMEAVKAAAVSPEIAFSLREAFAWSLAVDLDEHGPPTALEGFNGSGFRKASELESLFWEWEGLVGGINAIETAEVAAIFNSIIYLLASERKNSGAKNWRSRVVLEWVDLDRQSGEEVD